MRTSSGRMNRRGLDRGGKRPPTDEDLALASALGRFRAASALPAVELVLPMSALPSMTMPSVTMPSIALPSIALPSISLPVPLAPGETGWRIPRFLQNLLTAMSGGATAETSQTSGQSERVSLADRRAQKRGGAGTGGDEQSADPEELHQLVVDHGDAIYRLALSVVRDKSLAEDIAQETLIKAWLALPTFRGDSSLRGWVLRITHNTAISTIRRRRAVVIDPHDMPETPIKVERSVESRVQGGVVMDDFVEALDLLDELSRSIVVLRELEGLSYDEISDVLEVPLPTVKTRLLRARRKLGAALREWE